MFYSVSHTIGALALTLCVYSGIPPLPNSSMIWYHPAKVEPVVSSSFGASMVLVGAGISSDTGSCVPQSPQNFWVSGLSALHLGHLFDIAVPFIQSAKGYQVKKKVSIN